MQIIYIINCSCLKNKINKYKIIIDHNLSKFNILIVYFFMLSVIYLLICEKYNN